jgi:GNAT superfamily N-acetyltransferase
MARKRPDEEGLHPMTLMARVGELRALAARWGPGKPLLAAVMRLFCPWLMLCRVQTRANQPLQGDLELPQDIEVRLANRAELLRGAAEVPEQLSPEFIDAALARGDICVAAFAEGSIVSLQWASFTTAAVTDRLWVRFRAPYRYGYRGYTRPTCRGRRIAKAVMRCCDALCLERGYSHTIVYAEVHNYASLANLARLGNRSIGFAGYLRCFGHYLPFRSPGVKAQGFRFYVAEPGRTEGNQ